MRPLVRMPKSKFIRVLCKKCKNEQIIFNKSSTVVKCVKCENELSIPIGGDSIIKAKILEVLS